MGDMSMLSRTQSSPTALRGRTTKPSRAISAAAPLIAALLAMVFAACGPGSPNDRFSGTSPRAISPAAYCEGHLPDPSFTPGRLCTPADPDFDGYRYPEGVAHCRRHVTTAMKLQIAAYYDVPQWDWPNHEFDHFIPLGIGGSSGIDNLWPQDLSEAREKDVLEDRLYRQLAAGQISQGDAVAQFYAWRPSRGVPAGCTGGTPGSCAHDVCASGSALDPSCDPCVASICAADPYCCENHWSSICVNEVASICGGSCP